MFLVYVCLKIANYLYTNNKLTKSAFRYETPNTNLKQITTEYIILRLVNG